jgi:hypothetical protein
MAYSIAFREGYPDELYSIKALSPIKYTFNGNLLLFPQIAYFVRILYFFRQYTIYFISAVGGKPAVCDVGRCGSGWHLNDR